MPLWPKANRVLPGLDPREVTLAAIESGNFGTNQLGTAIQFYLPYFVVINGDSVSHVLTFQFRSPGSANASAAYTIAAGAAQSFPTMLFQSVSCDSAGTPSSVGYGYADLPF